jgi:hypothetical protein
MGYHTYFNGRFKLSRNLTLAETQEFHDFVTTRRCRLDDPNKPPEGQPSLWCDWRIERINGEDREHLIAVDGKNYSHGEWLHYLCVNFFKPRGVTLDGRVDWQGQEEDDRGYYELEKDDPSRIKVYEANVVISYGLEDEYII